MNTRPAYPFKTLHEIAAINPPRPAVDQSTGAALYVSVNAVQANGEIAASASPAKRSARGVRYFEAGDLLLPMIGSALRRQCIGRVPTQGAFGSCSPEWCVVRVDAKQVNSVYLYHWLRQRSCGELIPLLQGTAQQRVAATDVANLQIALPPLEVQAQCAKVMELATRHKLVAGRLLQNASETVDALFVRWATRCGL